MYPQYKKEQIYFHVLANANIFESEAKTGS